MSDLIANQPDWEEMSPVLGDAVPTEVVAAAMRLFHRAGVIIVVGEVEWRHKPNVYWCGHYKGYFAPVIMKGLA